ncbi:MAG: hypothetical protein Ct9H300mP16_06280 [Pseudomonadota bacterium]|nr:MAG: hypothetical protein Ct9H300mP16_06280 [Pseudomonadota bacterium]
MLRAATLSRDPDVVVRAYGLTMQAGHHEAALEMAQLLVKMNPDSDRLRALELQALMALERPDEFFEKLVAHNSSPARSLVSTSAGRAKSLVAAPTRRPGYRSWSDSRSVITTRPRCTCSRLARLQGRPSRSCRQCVEPRTWLHPGWQQVALMKLRQLRKADDREALSAFVPRFLNKFPDSDELRLAWARLLTEWGEFEDALAQFDELVHRDPGNGDALCVRRI